jgi:TetR/AcrR family transcriptional regulator, transcriptional repressor for nem operon
MRKSKLETAKTRERILKAASAQFLSHGITEAGVARLMRTAGLTHGGFYRHFASKDQLVAEACGQAVLSLTSGLKSQIEGKPPDQALPLLVGKYLSRIHRDQPANGCVLAALGSELARADTKTREAATEGFLGLSRLIAGQLKNVPAKKAEAQSMAIAATLIGAMTISRIVPDSRISNSILEGTREHILKSVRRKC